MLKQEVIFGKQFNVLSEENLNCKLPKTKDVFTCISEETRAKMKESHKKRFQSMSKEKRQKLGWHNKGKSFQKKL